MLFTPLLPNTFASFSLSVQIKSMEKIANSIGGMSQTMKKAKKKYTQQTVRIAKKK